MKEAIEKFLILRPFLEAMEDGSVFRLVFSWFMRIQAAMSALVVLFGSYLLWKTLGKGLNAKTLFAAVFIQVFMLLWLFLVGNILLIRANRLQELPAKSKLPMTPIMSIFVKSEGEIFASAIFLISLFIGLISLTAGAGTANLLAMSIPGSSLFLGGAGFMAIFYGSIISLMIVFSAYYSAERIMNPVDTAPAPKRRAKK